MLIYFQTFHTGNFPVPGSRTPISPHGKCLACERSELHVSQWRSLLPSGVCVQYVPEDILRMVWVMLSVRTVEPVWM
jgi:hypothetical protein